MLYEMIETEVKITNPPPHTVIENRTVPPRKRCVPIPSHRDKLCGFILNSHFFVPITSRSCICVTRSEANDLTN